MGTTLTDIASLAGVSPATVSRVINSKPGVSEELRENVVKAIRELGMSPDRLQRNGKKPVAIISPDLVNPIFPEYVTTLTTLLAQRGLLSFSCSYTLAGVSEEQYITMLQDQPLTGAIFLAGSYDTLDTPSDTYDPLLTRNVPLIFLNGAHREMKGVYLGTNNSKAMTMALRHLFDLGHQRIGLLLGDRKHHPSVQKYEAAERFFLENHIEHPSAMTIWTTYGFESGQVAAMELVRQGATAIACANDQLALGSIRAATVLGLRIPEDISIIGFDDSPSMKYMTPSLTTIRQPLPQICRAAVSSLLASSRGAATDSQHNELLFDPELIVRESTGRNRNA
ncbi:LacI family DNA-binding transcriptional regulator [Bifidobacterium pseudolongum]|uniref:Transcriptional regulator n=1 Tax=Bifidobacterium pseudolongum subsp. globosum TaxID=1690 RepID=A0A4Q5AGY7_9BIFI|nr:LacI family DNA-binding transcriptional regulator [Bifidobacterium pseudolongum]RYQ27155.1 transcriptional regulator [Bifidobacterium pseudolongum subsp. globosum]RYQ27594.1 transcriptional regulator [Bifidobacterium pseudolongum subsp. globosum]RYQ67786.1 transcriptional regulator [Bifidobacterium pseudolongum subsp. globosum]